MKLRRLATAGGITFGISLLCVFLVAIAAMVVDRARTTYPTPEMRSAFLQSYTLAPVLDRFTCTKHPYGGGDGFGSGAGYGFATHEREFHHFFVMKSSERAALMAALFESVASQLNSAGAQISAETGEAAAGFHFDYVIGKSRGTVSIDPLEKTNPAQTEEAYRLMCPDSVSVLVNVRIEEKWIKSGA
ncbi:MAG: hypothetical protein WBV55_18200 [Candidatus Sulfotelmatobacter sp.]